MTVLSFSEEEMDRILILDQVKNGLLTQRAAGNLLGVTDRQIRRLLNRIADEGIAGVKARPKGGNRSFDASFKEQVLNCVKKNYRDFGPTFASEKLSERDDLKVNKETLRQWMIEEGLWEGRARKQARIHQSRQRRPRFGELIQIDGSHHDWFEGRDPKCCLLVFIDDATSKVLGMYFDKSETSLGYMTLIQSHLLNYGRPIAFYSDKHSIFKTTREQCLDRRLQDTQVQRALRSLQIQLICAHSSQAKGRVERANQTLQDRLVKEMRLRNISSIDEANAFVPLFLEDYNKRFSVEPAHPEDAHRVVHHTPEDLRRILSVHTQRKLSKNLEFSLNSNIYQITTPGKGYSLRYKTVTVCEHIDGRQEVMCGDQNLGFKALQKDLNQPPTVDTKELNPFVDEIVKDLTQMKERSNRVAHRAHTPCPA